MKFRRASRDVLYVPLYLRSFNVTEKVIVTVLIFLGSISVGLIPLANASINTAETTTTKIDNSEAELWRSFGARI
ncbi:MAG: hypothetical protein AAGF83_26415 [Cyanobacteria bacterium P01_G01_bin.67]